MHEKSKGTTLTCTLCDNEFSKNYFKHHILNVHHNEKIFSCDICKSSFSQLTNMKKHRIAVHEKSKPFWCLQCDVKCISNAVLKSHIARVHEKIKSFKCEKCEKLFATNQYLMQHMRMVHEKLKPWKCESCGKSFVAKQSLDIHVKSIHENFKVNCLLCDRAFTQKTHLRTHMKSHSKWNMKTCEISRAINNFEISKLSKKKKKMNWLFTHFICKKVYTSTTKK